MFISSEVNMKILKSFLLTFFSLGLFCVGAISLSFKGEETYAETISVPSLENELPDYVGVEELLPTEDSDEPLGDAVENSLIDDNIFLVYQNGAGNSNGVRFSLKANGAEVNPDSTDQYQYVYYPNPNDLSTFYFYQVTGESLTINGQSANIDSKVFRNVTNSFFNNESGIYLEEYEVNFAINNIAQDETSNTINLLDENNNLVEGRYTFSVNIVLWTVTDGTNDGTEDQISSSTHTITFSFMVLSEDDYILNSNPIFTANNYDSATTDISPTIDLNYGNYYYFNHSASDNQIMSLSYNQDNYDLTITKNLNSQTEQQTIEYVEETDSFSTTGDSLVTYIKVGNTTTVYFSEIGNYEIDFNAVATFPYQNETTYNKYELSALSDRLKGVKAFVYGYQAVYIDYDNNRQYTEFSTYSTNSGALRYENSADITSAFLESNLSFGQNTSLGDDTGTRTFGISNVLNYINNNNVEPVKTNQTPVRLEVNARQSQTDARSYIYSTTQVNNAYTDSGYTLDGETLYSAQYSGGSISDRGKFIYIMAYTFDSFYTTTGSVGSTIVFYQVFYFEITDSIPTISLQTSGGTEVLSNSFTNQDVILINNNLDEVHNKDVTVQIYAYDYVNKSYMSNYGGENGINMLNAPNYAGEGNSLTLSSNAKYTIRIYFTNEIATSSTSIYNETNRIKAQYTFTIDKMDVENVHATNVSLISGTSTYDVLNSLNSLTTNQNIAVSWNTKASGAETFAYYRYFPITPYELYPEDETTTSNILQTFLTLNAGVSYMPINYALDFTTQNNDWIRYDNAPTSNATISSNYVLSNAGLYVFDIYDSAGNHTIEFFIVDTTSPIFALETNNVYSLIPTTHFISESSTLWWGEYKALTLTNFETYEFNSILSDDDLESITASDLDRYNVYKDYNGNTSVDLFKEFYNTLYVSQYVQYINCSFLDAPTEKKYLTIGIDDISWQTASLTSDDYQQVSGAYSVYLAVQGGQEYTYRVLIRDLSNTEYETGGENALIQYTAHYSARQNIIVSHDDSEFRIYYGEEALSSNTTLSGNDETNPDLRTLTTYLSPVNFSNDVIYVSYIPTVIEEGTVQVDKVTMDYYAYEMKSQTVNGVTYYYRELATEPTNSTELYNYERDGINTETLTNNLRVDEFGVTSEGKYVITRTYRTDEGFEINEHDYYSRTYVLIVDRNDVITSPITIEDDTGHTHVESLVGGEIFVSMYDSGTNASLVVNFPNASDGSTDSVTLSNSTDSLNSILSTNKLPVNIYVPKYKYTQYVLQNESITGGYANEVHTSDEQNFYETETVNGTEQGRVGFEIEEYLLYAEIYRDYQNSTSTPLYISSRDWNNIDPSNSETTDGGYLVFYDASGNVMPALTEEGVYTVIIYQGYGDVGIGNESFYQSTMFTFTITSSLPDFTASTTGGRALNSQMVGGIETYYTNQRIVNISWARARDQYSAEIDQSNIRISYSIGGQGSTTVATNASTLFSSISSSTSTYTATLDFTNSGALGNDAYSFYQNGSYIDITMQFENHNSEYYSTVTKRIYIDTEAPKTNITNLVNGVINNTYSSDLISYEDLRLRYDVTQNNIVSDDTQTAYNISSISGTFRYYSYSVTADYMNTLLRTNSSESSQIYYREVEDKYDLSNSSFETSPDNFISTRYTLVSSSSTFNPNTYYEIVETDLAGNLTIYSVFVVDYTDTNEESENFNLITYTVPAENNTTETQSFTKADYNTVISTQNHSPRLNIYSEPGLILTDLNYFGNEWAIFSVSRVRESGTNLNSYYLMTPWTDEGLIYQIQEGNLVEVDLSSIIDGSLNTAYKNSITFYDSNLNSTNTFYINTRNTLLSSSTSTVSTREYISISQPTTTLLESTQTASTYVESMRIYTPATVGVQGSTETVYYESSSPLGYVDGWSNNSYISVSETNGNVVFEFNSNVVIQPNTRIIYEFYDNYGNLYREIHLYQETTDYNEIDTLGNTLYSFYLDNNLTYITANGFVYTYNSNKYQLNIFRFEGNILDANERTNDAYWTNADTNDYTFMENLPIRAYIFERSENDYNYFYRIDVYDTNIGTNGQQQFIKSVYFIINNQLPIANTSSTNNTSGTFHLVSNGRNVTNDVLGIDNEAVNYYSRVNLYYNVSNTTFLPVKVYLSTDNQNWVEVANGTQIECPDDAEQITYYIRIWYDMEVIADRGYYNQLAGAEYIFGTIPTNQTYTLTLSSNLSTAYYLVVYDENGGSRVVNKSGNTYTAETATTGTTVQYANHYTVNIHYSERNNNEIFDIITNTELQIIAEEENYYLDNQDGSIRTYIYTISNTQAFDNNTNTSLNIPRFSTTIAITFMEATNQFVDEFYTYNSAGVINRSQNLVNMTSFEFIANETSTVNRLQLQWSKYYGIEQNTISIHVTKNGIALEPTVYSRTDNGTEYFYTYLTRSGQYRITFTDTAGNVQSFGNALQTDSLTLTFLVDIPFSLTYTNPLTQQLETTEPIDRATYNSQVTLTLDTAVSNVYSPAGVSLTATLNGEAYEISPVDGNYVFTDPGYYTVTFQATSSRDGALIKYKTYSFTIASPNEYRYSYIMSKYSNYYIERVIKDNVDVTDTFVSTLDLATIVVDQEIYLTELNISNYDERTGPGVYYITVNSNEKLYSSENTRTSWTFKVIIQVGTENLIASSIPAGSGSTDPITITFNPSNIYDEYGESTLQIVYYNNNGELTTQYSFDVNETTTNSGVQTYTLDRTNTYLVQIVSSRGLMYSFKVVKEEPFNASTIIAIVVSVVVLVVVIILIIKLRKRIKVK